jgi:hypothetical protein
VILTTGQVIRWWELRRLLYNAVLLVIGVLAIAGMELGMELVDRRNVHLTFCEGGWIVVVAEEYARALRVLLECRPQLEWACLARSILFMSTGRATFMGSIALHGIESGAS